MNKSLIPLETSPKQDIEALNNSGSSYRSIPNFINYKDCFRCFEKFYLQAIK